MGLLCFIIILFRRTWCLPWGDNLWCSEQFRNRVFGGTRYIRCGDFQRLDKCSSGDSVTFVQFSCLYWKNWYRLSSISSFAGPADDNPDFSGAGDESTEAKVTSDRRRKHVVITRRFVPLSGRQPSPVEFGSRTWSRALLEQAFDDSND